MSKKLWILVLASVALFWPGDARADDQFPSFNLQTVTIKFEEREFTAEAQFFTDGQAMAQTVANGFSGSTDRSTPWKTMTELFAAYQQQDYVKLASLYTGDSATEIQAMHSDPQQAASLGQIYAQFSALELVFGIRTPGTEDLIVMTRITKGNDRMMLPYILIKLTDENAQVTYKVKGGEPGGENADLQALVTVFTSREDPRSEVTVTP